MATEAYINANTKGVYNHDYPGNKKCINDHIRNREYAISLPTKSTYGLDKSGHCRRSTWNSVSKDSKPDETSIRGWYAQAVEDLSNDPDLTHKGNIYYAASHFNNSNDFRNKINAESLDIWADPKLVYTTSPKHLNSRLGDNGKKIAYRCYRSWWPQSTNDIVNYCLQNTDSNTHPGYCLGSDMCKNVASVACGAETNMADYAICKKLKTAGKIYATIYERGMKSRCEKNVEFPGCLNWCFNNPGKCNTSAEAYCNKSQFAESDFCRCLNPKPINLKDKELEQYVSNALQKPECYDRACAERGYKTQSSAVACPDINICVQRALFDVSDGATVSNVSQVCNFGSKQRNRPTYSMCYNASVNADGTNAFNAAQQCNADFPYTGDASNKPKMGELPKLPTFKPPDIIVYERTGFASSVPWREIRNDITNLIPKITAFDFENLTTYQIIILVIVFVFVLYIVYSFMMSSEKKNK